MPRLENEKLAVVSPLRPPGWFRYGIVAVATLILCSCQAIGPFPTPGESLEPSGGQVTAASFAKLVDSNQVMPAIYQEDSLTPPLAIQQAEYAEGLRPAVCAYSLPDCDPRFCATGGPAFESRDEYLYDGGDAGLPAAVRADWQIEGVEQEDTVAHYDTLDGRVVVAPSNQVRIYSPRFGAVRQMIDIHETARYDMPGGFETPLALSGINDNEHATTSLNQLEPSVHRAENPPSQLRERQQLGELDRDQRLAEFDGSLAPYANLQVIRAGEVSADERALVARASLAAIAWSGDQAPQITLDSRNAQATIGTRQAGVVYHTQDQTKPRLRLVKLASRSSAQPGEEIEFTLRLDNIGSQVIGNLTIVDNLTTRLEYVPESATSTLEADFHVEPNDGGSLVLRWEIRDPVEAGEGGIVQFKARVR